MTNCQAVRGIFPAPTNENRNRLLGDFKLRPFKNANSNTGATQASGVNFCCPCWQRDTELGGVQFGQSRPAVFGRTAHAGRPGCAAATLASLEGRRWKPQQRKKPHLAKKTSNESNFLDVSGDAASRLIYHPSSASLRDKPVLVKAPLCLFFFFPFRLRLVKLSVTNSCTASL